MSVYSLFFSFILLLLSPITNEIECDLIQENTEGNEHFYSAIHPFEAIDGPYKISLNIRKFKKWNKTLHFEIQVIEPIESCIQESARITFYFKNNGRTFTVTEVSNTEKNCDGFGEFYELFDGKAVQKLLTCDLYAIKIQSNRGEIGAMFSKEDFIILRETMICLMQK